MEADFGFVGQTRFYLYDTYAIVLRYLQRFTKAFRLPVLAKVYSHSLHPTLSLDQTALGRFLKRELWKPSSDFKNHTRLLSWIKWLGIWDRNEEQFVLVFE